MFSQTYERVSEWEAFMSTAAECLSYLCDDGCCQCDQVDQKYHGWKK